MLFWKLLVAADLLITIAYWLAVWKGREHPHGFDFASLPVGIIGTMGLVTYAFELPTLHPALWKAFLPIFLISGTWEIAAAIKKSDFDVGEIIGLLLAFLLVGFTSIALYRLGGFSWNGMFNL